MIEQVALKTMAPEEKQKRLDAIKWKLAENCLDFENVKGELEFLTEYVDELLRTMPVLFAARSLMIDLGRGNRDVSFPLAELHNALRSVDGKDYLAHKSNIIS